MVMLAPLTPASFPRTSAMKPSRPRSPNVNGTSTSLLFTLWACSSRSARPVLRVVPCTSGMVSSASSIRAPIVLLWSRLIPGRLTTPTTNEPSLNSGKKLRPSVAMSAMLPMKSTTAPITIDFRMCIMRASAAPYHAFNLRTSQLPSLCFSNCFSSVRSKLHSTGVTVTATISEANSATMNETPSGVSMRPSMPLRKNNGTNAAMMMSVALRMLARISVLAS